MGAGITFIHMQNDVAEEVLVALAAFAVFMAERPNYEASRTRP